MNRPAHENHLLSKNLKPIEVNIGESPNNPPLFPTFLPVIVTSFIS